MRGADDAHIDRRFADRAQRPHCPLLDHPQQLALHGQRQVADLVEEQRAAVRRLEEALAVLGSTGEGALAVAEEFGLEQLLRDRTTVDGDERLRAARRDIVDRTRHQFLAGARLALHQHRRHAARDLLDQPAHLLHRQRLAGQPLQCRHRHRRWRARAPRQRGLARRQPTEGRRHDGAELPQIDRLGQVVIGAGLQRLDRVLGRSVGGDDDRALRACRSLQPLQQLQPRAVRQTHVRDQQGKALRTEQRPGLLDAAHALDLITLAQQAQLVEGAQVGLVVDDEQAGRRGGGHGGSVQALLAVAKVARRITTRNSLRSRSALGRGRYSMLAP